MAEFWRVGKREVACDAHMRVLTRWTPTECRERGGRSSGCDRHQTHRVNWRGESACRQHNRGRRGEEMSYTSQRRDTEQGAGPLTTSRPWAYWWPKSSCPSDTLLCKYRSVRWGCSGCLLVRQGSPGAGKGQRIGRSRRGT